MLGFSPIASAPLGANVDGDKVLAASSGTFTLSMHGAAKLISDVYPSGVFVSDGKAITFSVQRAFVADAGSFTLSGQDASVTGQFNLAIDSGSFTLTGQDVVVTAQLNIAADAGAFVLTGTGAEIETRTDPTKILLDRNYGIPLAAGTFALTYSNDLDFKKGFGLIVNSGTFASTVYDVTFTKDMNIYPDSGTFTLSGEDAAVTAQLNMLAGSGPFTLTGQDFTLTVQRYFAANSGTFTLTFEDFTIKGFLSPYVPPTVYTEQIVPDEIWVEQEDASTNTWTEAA
jgi:hypothetical protein